MEYWDLYDKNEVKTGQKVAKTYNALPLGFFHIIVETLVRHSDGTYLVTQRALTKKEYPGKYEGSAGGSVVAGESKVEAAIREVSEETALKVKLLQETYYFVDEARGVISQGYLAETSQAKNTISYRKSETINHQWLTLKELILFVQSDEYNESHRTRLLGYLRSLIDEQSHV